MTQAGRDALADRERDDAVADALRQDPAGVYGRCDRATRDRYRRAVDELADWSGRPAVEVAEIAVREARDEHVGHLLLSPQRIRLETALQARVPTWARVKRRLGRNAEGWYVGVLVAVICVGVLAGVSAAAPAGPGAAVVAGVLALALVTRFARTVVDAVLNTLLPAPEQPPRLDIVDGVDPAHRTVIAYPVIVTDAGSLPRLLDTVETNWRGNRDPNLVHVVLVDFADASERTCQADDVLWADLLAGLAPLNEVARAEGAPPVIALRRERRWNEIDRLWMGWERKRGKLEEFCRLLLGDPETSFLPDVESGHHLHGARYVLTLDEDSKISGYDAAKLVATMAHPLNAPVLRDGRLIGGYGIVRPRVRLVALGPITVFQWLAYGLTPGRPPARLASSVYQELFKRDVFLGEGLLDIATYHALLVDRIPENTLLSHDKLESSYVRTALVPDVEVTNGACDSYLVYRQVIHRWTRGDWFLLRWLVARRTSPLGARGLLERWQILSDLNRPLSYVAALLTFLLSWSGFLPGSALAWSAAAMVALAATLVVRPLATVFGSRTPGGGRRRRPVRSMARGARREFLGWLMWVCFLPDLAVLYLGAVATACYQMLISGRDVLRWERSLRVRRRLRAATRGDDYRIMAAAPLAAVGSAILFATVRPSVLPYVWPVLLAWAGAPLLAYRVARPRNTT